MSNELYALIERVEARDPALAVELRKRFELLSKRLEYGLNFERHTPETVALAGRTISVGDRVRFLPPRSETEVDSVAIWVVTKIYGAKGDQYADLVEPASKNIASRPIEDLVYVADFREPIYPGLISTGKIERGGDKPFHVVINAENYHALEAMLYTNQGDVDVIYIDPPYNSGARDWKYNNDYVDGEDDYRHSKWLAFMERRLKVARRLLNPRGSVLIVAIDEKEYLRLGLLLEQTFKDARIQMVSVAISPPGGKRDRAFRRSDEYLFFVSIGDAAPAALALGPEWQGSKRTTTTRIRWVSLIRSGTGAKRADRSSMFYPILLGDDGSFAEVGAALAPDEDRSNYKPPAGTVAVWPIREDGSEGRWRVGPSTAASLRAKGFLRIGEMKDGTASISYLKAGEQKKVLQGIYGEVLAGERGHVEVEGAAEGDTRRVPTTQWSLAAHSAAEHGSRLLREPIPGRKFDFPKSLYAVEDALRFYLDSKPDALVLDFFSGSGTTAHAVMRLNKQDGGRRRSISVTNNEVSADEQDALRAKGLRPGDQQWEMLGICDYITKPRIEAAITGVTHTGARLRGDYKFVDEFPMSDGFEENVEFFTLTYENPALVEADLAFARISPLLWLKAGSNGRRIDDLAESFEIADTYAVLFNVDNSRGFLAALDEARGIRIAYIITDDETQYQAIAGQLPEGVLSVRLYESYLRTFQINTGRK